jgi:hypothetical protein
MDRLHKSEGERARDTRRLREWAAVPYPRYQFYIYIRTKQFRKYHYIQLRDEAGVAMLFPSERAAERMIASMALNPDHCRVIPARRVYLKGLL